MVILMRSIRGVKQTSEFATGDLPIKGNILVFAES
jgi:hypothetical protein